jgi:hypothetical protein
MAYDQLPGAELRLARARDAGDEEEIARATRALSRVRAQRACGARWRGRGRWRARLDLYYKAKNSSIVIVGHPVATEN